MDQRIVIYRSTGWAPDEETLAAVERVTGLERGAIEERLAARPTGIFENLDPAVAVELEEVLRASGADVERESMALETSRSEFLTSEIPKWVKRGLIHPASAPLIYGNYRLEPPPEVATHEPVAGAQPKESVGSGTFLRAVLTLGAALIGLGLILFVAANWQRIPAPAKVSGALALSLAALHGGYYCRFVNDRHQRLGAALLWIALFGIGGVIALIGQIYHVEADSYLLPLVWGALCVPVALLLRFPAALYATSGLWFWANWLFELSRNQGSWFYPALLLGLLVPYALITERKWLHVTNLATLMAALLLTLASEGFLQGSLLVAGLIVLRTVLKKQLYDWLLVAAFFIWHISFLIHSAGYPSYPYALPLAYFFYRAYRDRSNWLMAVTVVNATLWVPVLLLQMVERYELEKIHGTEPLLWFFAVGVLWFGLGRRLASAGDWRILSLCLRFGGGALAGLMSYVFSFRFYDEASPFFGPIAFLVATALAWLLGVVFAAPSIRSEWAGEDRSYGVLLLVALASVALLLTFVAQRDHAVHVVAFNLLLFAGGLVMMVRGHRAQSLWWFNGGIALFVWMIGTRYFDTFVRYLPRSVFFVIGGLFLIGWAILADRQRKRRARRREAANV